MKIGQMIQKFITGEDIHIDTNVEYEKQIRHYFTRKQCSTECG
jgi:hypothetical protein